MRVQCNRSQPEYVATVNLSMWQPESLVSISLRMYSLGADRRGVYTCGSGQSKYVGLLCVILIGVGLIGVSLIGVGLIGIGLIGVNVIGVNLIVGRFGSLHPVGPLAF